MHTFYSLLKMSEDKWEQAQRAAEVEHKWEQGAAQRAAEAALLAEWVVQVRGDGGTLGCFQHAQVFLLHQSL
jgi:hypothetical protein